MKQIVSYGAGTNSLAMVVGLLEHGERPDAILFADTGSEKPHTYELIPVVSRWCEDNGFPPITRVRPTQPQMVKDGSLEASCVRLGTLPSKAFGKGGCSLKWKIEPMNVWVRAQGYDLPVQKLVGIDAGESHRAQQRPPSDSIGVFRYPLIEWDWGRYECMAAIARAGLPQPGKSACFFCPSSKKPEIKELYEKYPELLRRALDMERRALNGEGPAPAPTEVKGLGRGFSWASIVYEIENQMELTDDYGAPEWDCGCYDG